MQLGTRVSEEHDFFIIWEEMYAEDGEQVPPKGW
jgi:hypothetical protein